MLRIIPSEREAAIAASRSERIVVCNVCGRPGGTSARGKLRVLLRRWEEMNTNPDWTDPSWKDGHVHAECYLDQQRVLSQRH